MTMKKANLNKLFWLDDLQWSVLEKHLPKKQTGPKRKDDRRMISGIIHVLQSGCRWQDCPSEYGPSTTVHNRYHRWAQRGIWEGIFRDLTSTWGRIMRTASIARSSKRTAQPAVKRGRQRSHRQKPGRTHDENSRRNGQTRPSDRVLADAGQCVRHQGRQAASGTAQGFKATSG